MAIYQIHADRPPACVEPRAHRDESHRYRNYGPLVSMDEAEATTKEIYARIGKAWIWFAAPAAVLVLAYALDALGWFAWSLV